MAVAVRSTELRRDADGVVRHGSEWLALWADPDSMRSPEARARDLIAARATAQAERAVAATLRAIARHPALEVRFGGADAAALPSPGRPPSPDALAVARGAADAMAARLRHHDPRQHTPPPGEAGRIVDAAEQARCEALLARALPGTLPNLRAHAEARLERLGCAHARLAADLPLHEAMAVVLRTRLTPDDANLPSLGLRLWDRWVRTHLAAKLAALAASLDDQAAYAAAAGDFVEALFRSIGRAEAAMPPPQPTQDPGDDEEIRARIETPAPAPDDRADGPPPSRNAAAPAAPPGYAAFTTAYDRVVVPTDLADAAELLRLRARLDAEAGGMRSLLSRLANQLQRRLLAQQRRAWDFDLEEGLLDAAKLDRVVVAPEAPLSFKQERDAAFRDTVVALLIDCSGSMRGRPILLAAIAADICARALDRCGVRCEVLGFSTADFAGGRSAADWGRAGHPPSPGRLGDLRHIVLKSADASYRSARQNLGALLLPNILRENVDGEALAWARHRLLARRERRRVLVVISDGAPAEAATQRANPPGLLERHLADTIAGIEAEGAVELRAIGIRHDVSRHYRRAVTIPDAQMVGPALIAQLAAVFSDPHVRQR
jgi:cobaltochelatase CobT